MTSAVHTSRRASTISGGADGVIRSVLGRMPAGSLFLGELLAQAQSAGITASQAARAVENLTAASELVVVSFPPPDRHLQGLDLRVVALVDFARDDRPAATRAAEHFAGWARALAAVHRCS